MAERSRTVEAYIFATGLPRFGKNRRAYSLVMNCRGNTSWHWGVKNNEVSGVDMQMYALRRLLRAMLEQDLDRLWRARIIAPRSYLGSRLEMASQIKRDMDRKRPHKTLHNHEDWIETSILWDMFKSGLREAQTPEEQSLLRLAKDNADAEYNRIGSAFDTYKPFVESPEELVLELN